MINIEEFKNQLFEFVEFESEPFDIKYIYRSCIQPVDNHHIYEALYQLESEGKIIRLSDGRYTTMRAAVKRWVKEKLVETLIPDYLIREIEWTLKLNPGLHQSIDNFISEAVREYIEKVRG